MKYRIIKRGDEYQAQMRALGIWWPMEALYLGFWYHKDVAQRLIHARCYRARKRRAKRTVIKEVSCED